jgi:hypothetical protein
MGHLRLADFLHARVEQCDHGRNGLRDYCVFDPSEHVDVCANRHRGLWGSAGGKGLNRKLKNPTT